MLTIRNDQIKAFSPIFYHKFIYKMILFIKKNYPKHLTNQKDEIIKNEIEKLMKLAEDYSITREKDIQYFISMNYYLRWNGKINDNDIKMVFEQRGLLPSRKFEIVKELLQAKNPTYL